MCLNPILIPNPNKNGLQIRDINNKGITIGKPIYGEDDIRYYRDNSSNLIYIKCGHCSQCINEKIQGYAQRILMEGMINHLFLVTITYKNSMIPKEVITHSDGKEETILYADTQDVRRMFERMDKWRDRTQHDKLYIKYPYNYFGVTELGSEKGRPHIHIIIGIPKRFATTEEEIRVIEHELYWTIRKNWQRNINTNKNGDVNNRKPIYEPLFEYHEKWVRGKKMANYDCHYINPKTTANGESDAIFYVLKYLLKQLNNNIYEEKRKTTEQTGLIGQEYRKMLYLKKILSAEDFAYVWNKVRSRIFCSNFYGLGRKYTQKGNIIDTKISDYILNCIQWSKHKYKFPVFINPCNKRTAPLCEYYRKRFLSKDDKIFFSDMEEIYYQTEKFLTPEQINNKNDRAKAVARNLNKLTDYDINY